MKLLNYMILAFATSLISLSPPKHLPSMNQAMGTLKGTVMDANEAAIVLPKPIIVLKDGRNRTVKRIESDEDGGYEMKLPAGIYHISTEINGFYPVRRAAFRIQPRTSARINLTPMLRYLVRGTTLSAKHPIDKLVRPPKYDSFSIPQSSSKLLRLLIQFDKKRQIKDTVEYSDAVLSYDVVTIYADKIRFNRRSFRVKASGERVVVEDGKQGVSVRAVELQFKAGEPLIKSLQTRRGSTEPRTDSEPFERYDWTGHGSIKPAPAPPKKLGLRCYRI
ncbi:MAG TPA: carboxypeptidase-like regulatory domain-containing protein [Pyrinomonadaceae bacterium]|jgi:hypothetical protein